jgi:hypothetical protein
MAASYPREIHVLNRFAFFWPLWNQEHLKMVHETEDHNFNAAYAYHAWGSLAASYLVRSRCTVGAGLITSDRGRSTPSTSS